MNRPSSFAGSPTAGVKRVPQHRSSIKRKMNTTRAIPIRDFLGTFTIQLSPGRCTTGPKPPYLRRKAHFSHWWIKNTSLKPGANTLYQLCPVPTCGTHRTNQLVTSYARSPPVTPAGSTSWIFSRGEENHPQTRAGGWGQTNTTRMQPRQVELEECNRTPSKTSAPWSPLEPTCTFFLKQAIVNRDSIRNFNNTTPNDIMFMRSIKSLLVARLRALRGIF